jgi:hypothetical protein
MPALPITIAQFPSEPEPPIDDTTIGTDPVVDTISETLLGLPLNTGVLVVPDAIVPVNELNEYVGGIIEP